MIKYHKCNSELVEGVSYDDHAHNLTITFKPRKIGDGASTYVYHGVPVQHFDAIKEIGARKAAGDAEASEGKYILANIARRKNPPFAYTDPKGVKHEPL